MIKFFATAPKVYLHVWGDNAEHYDLTLSVDSAAVFRNGSPLTLTSVDTIRNITNHVPYIMQLTNQDAPLLQGQFSAAQARAACEEALSNLFDSIVTNPDQAPEDLYHPAWAEEPKHFVWLG